MTFFVRGVPITKGSFRALTFPGRKFPVVISDRSNKLKQWEHAIGTMAAAVGCSPIDGPVVLKLMFLLPRPAGHQGKRGLRPSAPATQTKKPDLDKLVRALLDALIGVAFHDDAQVVSIEAGKRFADDARGPGVVVTVGRLEGGLAFMDGADPTPEQLARWKDHAPINDSK